MDFQSSLSSSDDEYYDTISDVVIENPIEQSDNHHHHNSVESIETEIISSDKIQLESNSIETDSQVPMNFNELKLDPSDSSDSEEFMKDVIEKEGKNQFDDEKEEKIEGNPTENDESEARSREERERQERESILSPEERQERREKAIELKESGNACFRRDEFEEAVTLYSRALEDCPLAFAGDRAVFHSNKAAALARLDRTEDALGDLTAAIGLKPDYLKALLKRAELREKTDKLTEALEDYRAVLEIDPRNWSALHAQQTLPERIKIQQEKMKEEMINQLKQLGNLVLKPFGLSTDNFKMVQDPVSGGYSINFQNK